MSQVKAKDLRSLSPQELNEKILHLNKHLFELRQKQISGQLEKPHLFKQTRKQIAQIETIKKEKTKNV